MEARRSSPRWIQRSRRAINVIVHSYQDVYDRLARGQPFFADIARDGMVLYEAEGFPLATPKPLNAEERQAEAPRHFEHWFPNAAVFFDLAKRAMDDGHSRQAAFLLHQVMESLYHCVLLVLTLYSPKLHRLDRLRSQAESLYSTQPSRPQRASVLPQSGRQAVAEGPGDRNAKPRSGRGDAQIAGIGHRKTAPDRPSPSTRAIVGTRTRFSSATQVLICAS